MHLLEAFLAVRDLVDAERGSELSRPLVALFENRFFDAESCTLAEYYEPDWKRHPDMGQIIEPGHHFEWSWLLRQVGKARPADLLLDWGMAHGRDPEHDGFFDEVSSDGEVLKSTKRIWPVTECLKAWLARYEHSHSREHRREAQRTLDFLFEYYLLDDGRWVEHLAQDLTPTMTDMPGSTGYHITLALTEALRVLGR